MKTDKDYWDLISIAIVAIIFIPIACILDKTI